MPILFRKRKALTDFFEVAYSLSKTTKNYSATGSEINGGETHEDRNIDRNTTPLESTEILSRPILPAATNPDPICI